MGTNNLYNGYKLSIYVQLYILVHVHVAIYMYMCQKTLALFHIDFILSSPCGNENSYNCNNVKRPRKKSQIERISWSIIGCFLRW